MKKWLPLFMLGAGLMISACAQKTDMAGQANKDALERLVNEAWNNGNFEVVPELVATDFVRHNPQSWDPPEIEGSEAFKNYISEVRTVYQDFHVQAHARIAEGDMVATSWTVTGTNQETNKPIEVRGISMTRMADGKAVEEWATWDTHGVMQQAGMTGMESEEDSTME